MRAVGGQAWRLPSRLTACTMFVSTGAGKPISVWCGSNSGLRSALTGLLQMRASVIRTAPYLAGSVRLVTARASLPPRYPDRMRFGATVLYVNDVTAAADFYKRAFGMRVRFEDEALGFVELEADGLILALASHAVGEFLMPGTYSRPESGKPAGVEIAFLTEDVPAAFAKIVEQGAAPVADPKRMPWGLEVAYARAPDGTIIGLSEPPPGWQRTQG